jgi:hypothetical protein
VSSGGLGHATAKSTFTEIPNQQGDYVVANSTEANKSVFIVDGTDLWAAGDNTYGQLGLGNTTNGFLFQQVTLTNGVSQISTAGTNASTIVIETDGSITVFGYNALGQLGTGDLTQRNSPTTIAALGTNNKKVKLFGPDNYVAAYILKTDGTVFVSGYNGHGQLGTGDLTNRSTFTKMAKEDRVFIKDFQLFGYDNYNAFVGADQDDNLWGVGYNISYKFLSTTNGIGGDRSVLTKIDPVEQSGSGGVSLLSPTEGSAPYYGVRAFGIFNGSSVNPTPQSSGNVSSIKRTKTGYYEVTLNIPMADTNYTVLVTANHHAGAHYATNENIGFRETGKFQIFFGSTSGLYNPDRISFSVIG